MDGSLPGSSVHGILQARVLEWVAIAFSDKEANLRIYRFAGLLMNDFLLQLSGPRKD